IRLFSLILNKDLKLNSFEFCWLHYYYFGAFFLCQQMSNSFGNINENGFQSFLPVSSWTNPDPYANGDIIATLWTSFNADLIYYQQVTDGPLLARATVEINSMFLGLYFSASWLFITTWVAVPYSSNTGVATFQMVLVGGEDDELSFLLMNYGDIAPTGQPWLVSFAGYRSESGIYKYTIDEPNPSDLSKSTNKGLPGQWAFRVDEEMGEFTI
uniref:NIDO domain-containing protein n=1 Tax=Electrophorus electricus TaxID=8005 RepID=A0A4W4HID6_ELEEL